MVLQVAGLLRFSCPFRAAGCGPSGYGFLTVGETELRVRSRDSNQTPLCSSLSCSWRARRSGPSESVPAPSRARMGIDANLRQLMLHEAKPNPKPLGPTAVTRGFEAVAYPKIVRRQDPDDRRAEERLCGAVRAYQQHANVLCRSRSCATRSCWCGKRHCWRRASSWAHPQATCSA